MVEWSLLTLLVVLSCLIFLAFHAWRGIQAEQRAMNDARRDMDARLMRVEHAAEAARTRAEEACLTASQAPVLARDAAESIRAMASRADDGAVAAGKKVDVLEHKLISQDARIRALQRWTRRESADEEEQQAAGEEIPMFPAAPQPPPAAPVNGSTFGKVARR